MTTRRCIRTSTNGAEIAENEILSHRSREVGFFNLLNGINSQMLEGFRIVKNKIYARDSRGVGGGNLGNNFNGGFTFLLVLIALVLLLGLLGFAYYLTSTKSEMSRLTILISYGGRWVDSRYENFKAKGVLVSNTITLKELQKQVYDIVNVDPNDYEITMIAMYETMKSAWPVEIADDDDVRAFIFQSRLSSSKIPLCITLEETNLGGSPQAP
ncbi:hypothetical protein PRUPE_1G183900 [Prunus persica]|uniref:Uncharacterized protein n=1 Tax=Prunus persica TaxID=3760 RepID=A0A251QZH8_PRUPE|nr:uncharacterized protein LOC109948926 [Prunus persica]ONI29157.1 hypothetical protein PRUPE_1G183900 [Prunus persica]